jgi:hypothetical protein
MAWMIVRTSTQKIWEGLVMSRMNLLARTVGISALLAFSTTPALAGPGKAERARTAIAEAQGKVDAGSRIGAGGEAPALHDRAKIALANARADLANGKKDQAIIEAQHASELAGMAIEAADHRKVAAERAERHDAEAAAAQSQQAAAAANDRADAAQQAAATATAQADALRNAPPPAPVYVPVPTPAAPTTTTVATTERTVVHTPARAHVVPVKHVVKRRVVRKPGHAAVAEKTTTTTVTTQ